MTIPNCQRCEVKPANLGSAFFIQTEEDDGKTNETEYRLCMDCFDDLLGFLSGKSQPAINHQAAIKAGRVGKGTESLENEIDKAGESGE